MLAFVPRPVPDRASETSVPLSAGRDPTLDPERPVTYLPTRPWPFLWFFVRTFFLGRIALMVLAVVLGVGIESVEPWVLRKLINGLTAVGAGAATPADVVGWFVLLVGLWFVATGMFRAYQLIDIFTSPRLRERVQKLMFGYLLGHSHRYFQDNFAGKLGQKIKQAGQACNGLIEILCFEVTQILVVLVVAGALLVAQQPAYAAILYGWMLGYLWLSFVLARRCVKLAQALSEEVSTSSGRLIDAIANAELIRGFARSAFERRFLGRYIERERECSTRLRWFLLSMRVFQMVAVLSLLSGLIWLALRDTIAGRIDIGTFTMVFTLGGLIAHRVWNLSHRLLDFFEYLGTLTEAIDLVTQPHEIVDPPGAPALAVREGAIRFRDVRFAHADGAPVFEGLDLDIRPGEKIGLVGRSGAGKSTLVKLLRRQYLPQGGAIEIDGQDVTRVSWESLNAAIAEVPQFPGIFHRPIRDNIRYARPDAPEQEVIDAAARAHAHEFVTRRPTGYDTIVGEQGIKLSGGERQRVAIARALVKDARILVLDEATSSLDSESEHLIQEALWRLMQGRTVIAIAHRLSTITGMDRIVYLDQGRIVEEGSHAALVARDGPYARLWRRQMGGFLGAA